LKSINLIKINLNPEYLFAIHRKPSESIPNVEILSKASEVWYAGSYNTVASSSFKPYKTQIVNLTNTIKNRDTRIEDWDWHHVVESQHIALITVNGNLEQDVFYGMPTILIHKPEHRFFSRNSNNNNFKQLVGIIDEIGKKKAVDAGDLFSIKNQISNFRMMYNNLYVGYPILQNIANNVFNFKNFQLLEKMRKFGLKR
jgi:hypothetical protein